jgi:hypothetical protein
MSPRLAAIAAVTVAWICLAGSGCGSSESDEVSVSVPADIPREFFGVVPQAELFPDDLERMGEGQVGTLRLVVPWGLMDSTPEPEDINYGYVDPIVLGAAAQGIRVLPTLYGTPDWVAEGIDGAKCAPSCASVAPRSAEAIDAFAEFAGALVDRYGPKGELWETAPPDTEPLPVTGWQIWNEQNSPTFYQPEVDAQAYADLVIASADAIRERDPDAEVILGGMFGTPFKGDPPALSAPEFLRELYAIDGAREAFDSVAAHPYAAHQGKVELQLELLHSEIERADDDAGIWITEMGSSSDEAGVPLEQGLEGQAESLRASFEYFIEMRDEFDIRGVTWYSWRDTVAPTICDWCPGSGLFEQETLEPKPAWDVFVAFTGGT